jgi:hypothetical protein
MASAMMRRIAAAGLVCGILALPSSGQARAFVSFGFPPFFGPAYYLPPPVWYPAPSAVYAPPGALSPAGRVCHAEPYTCPLAFGSAPGSPCGCTGNDGRRVAGRAG